MRLFIADIAWQAEHIGQRRLRARGGRGWWRPLRRRSVSRVTLPPLARTISSIADARNGKMLVADRHRQRRDDGQGQRNAQGHPRTLARHGIDLDDAANALDVGADHVHADAAAGNGGHFLGGRQARLEDQCQLFACVDMRWATSRSITPLATAFSTSFDPSMPLPSSAISIRIWLPDWRARDGQQADFALAAVQSLGRRSRCHDRPRCG